VEGGIVTQRRTLLTLLYPAGVSGPTTVVPQPQGHMPARDVSMTAVSGRENDSCVNHDVKVSRNEISREVVLHEGP